MFSSLFNWLMGAGRELAVVLISMVPLVELRGAVPLGAVAGVPAIELIPLAVIGNMIPIPFYCFSAKSCWTGCARSARFPDLPPSTVKSCSERPVRSPGMNGWVCSFLWRSRCRAPEHGRVH
mgnify:FL=1